MKVSVSIPDVLWEVIVASRPDDVANAGPSRVVQHALDELLVYLPSSRFIEAFDKVSSKLTAELYSNRYQSSNRVVELSRAREHVATSVSGARKRAGAKGPKR